VKFALYALDIRWAAGIETAGQGIAAMISEYERLLDILRPQREKRGR
jgi:hypothetical protein